MESPAYSQPMNVRVVDSDVVVLGPNGVAISITPDCADESARRLIAAARQARAFIGERDDPD